MGSVLVFCVDVNLVWNVKLRVAAPIVFAGIYTLLFATAILLILYIVKEQRELIEILKRLSGDLRRQRIAGKLPAACRAIGRKRRVGQFKHLVSVHQAQLIPGHAGISIMRIFVPSFPYDYL